MTDDFAQRIAALPPELLKHARNSCYPGANMQEVLETAERFASWDCHRNLDRIFLQPFLTERETHVVKDALLGHSTDIVEDQPCLAKLQESFVGWLIGYEREQVKREPDGESK